MNRMSLLHAVWRVNRTLPLLLCGLLLLNLGLFFWLFFGVYPREDRALRGLGQLQRESRHGLMSLTPQKSFEQGGRDLARFRDVLPDSRNFADLIGDLYTLADTAHLEISQIGYDPKEIPEEGLLSYGLRFALTGTYGELKRFIYGLEQSQRIFVIDNLALAAVPGVEGDVRQVSLNLQLTTYFRQGGGQ